MEELYLKILERLQSDDALELFECNNLQSIRYIDLYRGQPIRPERFEAFMLPAVFVGYSINWETQEVTIDIHVMLDQNHTTSNISPNRLKGLDMIRYYEVLKDLLIDLETSQTTKLRLLNERPIEADVVDYQILSFNCRIEKILLTNNIDTELEELNLEEGVINKYTV